MSLMGAEVCGRFCIRFFYGNCRQGQNCEFCHLTHREPKVKMDKVGESDHLSHLMLWMLWMRHRLKNPTVVSLLSHSGNWLKCWERQRRIWEVESRRVFPQGNGLSSWCSIHFIVIFHDFPEFVTKWVGRSCWCLHKRSTREVILQRVPSFLHGIRIWDWILGCCFEIIQTHVLSPISQVLALVLPHIERRCERNGLKLGTLQSRHQRIGIIVYGILIIPHRIHVCYIW